MPPETDAYTRDEIRAINGLSPMEQQKSYRFRGHVRPDENVAARAEQLKPKALLESTRSKDGVAALYLYDVIDPWGGEWGVSASEFTAALNDLDDDTQEIQLHINSPGGSVWEGIAILNSLREHPAKITAVVDGLAASAASFIASGADELVMGGNSQLMIHDAWGLCVGNAGDMRDVADRLDKVSDNIARVYQAKAGGDLAGWRAAMLAESWYSDEEAVAIGLADRIAGADTDDDELQPAASAPDFDLTMFKHEGRDKAPAPNSTQTEPEPESTRRAFQDRRHRMNERKHALRS